jgi:fatty-acyl-CoA synthase
MTTVATSYWPADTSEPVLETTVGGILRAAAAAGPDMLAMVGGVPDPGQRRRWTYAELLAEAEQAARALTARFAPGERVAVWAPNLPEWVILEYAAGLAGLVLVTVNPALRPAELAYVLNQSGAAGIFLVPEFRSPMAQFLAEVRPDVPALRDGVTCRVCGPPYRAARRCLPSWCDGSKRGLASGSASCSARRSAPRS